MSGLPPKIISDILSRLPPKSVLRFRCVSKPWYALIDGTDFIKLHLSRSIGNDSRVSYIGHVDGTLYSLDLDSLETVFKFKPTIPDFKDYILRCSCNGLLLFEHDESDALALFNPSTRKHLILPDPPEADGYGDPMSTMFYEVYSLGHDSLNDDYKVLKVVEIRGIPVDKWIASEAFIFSLKLNSWRRVENFWSGISTPDKQSWSPQVHGAFHTILLQNRGRITAKVIVAFDIGTESFRLFDLPKFVNKHMFEITPHVFGGCLCITGHIAIDCTEIWIMKEYGVKQSWIKLLSIVLPRPLIDVRPLVYSKNHQKVLVYVDNVGFVWYDLREKTVKKVWVRSLPNLVGADTYVGSLVPLNGCHDLDEIKKRHGQEKLKEEKKKKSDDFLSKEFKLKL